MNTRRPRLEVNAMKLVLRSLTNDRVSGIREDVVKALSAADGRRRDTLFCTGDYRYGVPLDDSLFDPCVDEGGEGG
jgi:hypothetical protein